MKNSQRLTFWNKLKYSILDFEKYQDLAMEKLGRTILYIVILMIIFSIVVAGIYTYKFAVTIKDVSQYISDNIETITFQDNILNIIPKNNEEITKLENENIGIKVIINTQTNDESKINQSIEEIRSEENAILILSDKIVVKSEIMTKPYEYSYANIAQEYNINILNKQEVLRLLSNEIITPLVVSFSIIMFIYMFIIYLSSVLIDIIILSIFAYIVSSITKMRLKYSAMYNIAAYSITLPVILNLIYVVVNKFTGFTIKYFEVMYTTVATIYIATAILMIRSDTIKKQIELTKIIEEQDRVREEIQRREEEQKEEEEKQRQKKKEEKERKQKEENDDKLGKEPEGNNV